jgi:hypothetical protein
MRKLKIYKLKNRMMKAAEFSAKEAGLLENLAKMNNKQKFEYLTRSVPHRELDAIVELYKNDYAEFYLEAYRNSNFKDQFVKAYYLCPFDSNAEQYVGFARKYFRTKLSDPVTTSHEIIDNNIYLIITQSL